MYRGLLRRARRPIVDVVDRFTWLRKTSSHESVYFYTFHKCASSLFSGYVLKNIQGLRHLDCASRDYRGKSIKKVELEETGYVYGPIRLSTDPALRIYETLIAPASSTQFIRDKIAIFLVRDPRDILVSAYYSFGFSHGLSPVREIRENQELIRRRIQAKALDEYVLDSANAIAQNFKTVERLERACERGTVLRYEDMINDFDRFIHDLTRYTAIDPRVAQQIYDRSRPKRNENASAHRRSGQPGGFRDKLKQETVTSLNRKLEDVLERFHYEA